MSDGDWQGPLPELPPKWAPSVNPQSPMGSPKLVRAGVAPLPVVPLGGPQSVWVGAPGTTAAGADILASYRTEVDRLHGQLDQLRAQLAGTQGHRERLVREAVTMTRALNSLTAERDALDGENHALREALDEWRAQGTAIREIVLQGGQDGESVRRQLIALLEGIMSGHNPKCDPPESVPPLPPLPTGRDTAAPELREAMAETAKVRERYADLCQEFGPSAQSGWSARISLTVLNRHRASAGLDKFTRTESNDHEDTMLRYRRERDEAREQLEQLRAVLQQARAWADSGDAARAHHVIADTLDGVPPEVTAEVWAEHAARQALDGQ